ncbi:MAG TPA: hypothetical protein VGI43_16490 [Mucilaginibacter sp.]
MTFTATYAQKVIKTVKASRYSIHVFGDHFEGVIFSNKYNVRQSDTSSYNGFTPNLDEVAMTEKLINLNLKSAIDNVDNSGDIILKNLASYVRQYFGYTNEKHDRIIYINCFYKGNTRIYLNKKVWLKQKVFVYDGGPAFWQVKLNLTTEKFFDVWVNH